MQKILAAFINNRDNYNRLSTFILPEELPSNMKVIYKEIVDYYTIDEQAQYVDSTILISNLTRKYPRFAKEFIDIIDNLPIISEINVINEFLFAKRALISDKIIQALATGQEKLAEDLIKDWQEYKTEDGLNTKGTEIVTNFDIQQMVNKQKNPEFLLRPSSLNKQYNGGMDRGEHLILFGRVNTGKSLLCLNLVAGWLIDGHKVLYIGNEDRPDKLIMRLVWRLANMTKQETLEDPIKAEKRALARGLQQGFVFAGLSPGTFDEIRGLIEKHNPAIVVLDQIRNITLNSDGLTQKLEKAAILARNMAKYHKLLFVSITQAGATAVDKLVLEMEDIDSSKTGIQATADLIVGIGSNEIYDGRDMRMLSTPKNKEGNDHWYTSITIDTQKTAVYDTEN